MQTLIKCAYCSYSQTSPTVEESWARCGVFFAILISGSQTQNRQGNFTDA